MVHWCVLETHEINKKTALSRAVFLSTGCDNYAALISSDSIPRPLQVKYSPREYLHKRNNATVLY